MKVVKGLVVPCRVNVSSFLGAGCGVGEIPAEAGAGGWGRIGFWGRWICWWKRGLVPAIMSAVAAAGGRIEGAVLSAGQLAGRVAGDLPGWGRRGIGPWRP